MYIEYSKYLKMGEMIKIVVHCEKKGFDAKLIVNGKEYTDAFNDCEPYDVKTHIFYVPEKELHDNDKLVLKVRKHKRFKNVSDFDCIYHPVFENEDKLLKEYDSEYQIIQTKTDRVDDGVLYSLFLCKDKNGAPVQISLLDIDSKKASLYIGTPDDGYQSTGVKAKVPEMIEAAVNNNVNAVAAMNADFFDMFGDCHPSGLCVKNGKVIANENSKRPFIGIKKNGDPVITDITIDRDIVGELDMAAAGLEMIVKDGAIYEWGPLEPFSFVRHPRTAAGITEDGRILLLEVDGRIPEHSNGATLVDLAKFMIYLGADRAINLDGGGSSIVYTKQDGMFMLRNFPADLIRPRAKLIRKEFNCLIVVKK